MRTAEGWPDVKCRFIGRNPDTVGEQKMIEVVVGQPAVKFREFLAKKIPIRTQIARLSAELRGAGGEKQEVQEESPEEADFHRGSFSD